MKVEEAQRALLERLDADRCRAVARAMRLRGWREPCLAVARRAAELAPTNFAARPSDLEGTFQSDGVSGFLSLNGGAVLCQLSDGAAMELGMLRQWTRSAPMTPPWSPMRCGCAPTWGVRTAVPGSAPSRRSRLSPPGASYPPGRPRRERAIGFCGLLTRL